MKPPISARELGATLQQAAAKLQAGQRDKAAALCQQVLSRVPGQPDALHLLSKVMLDSGRPAEAEKCFLASLASSPRRADILVNYGNFLRQQGRLAEARKRLRKAVKLESHSVPALYGLALTLFKLGELRDAASYIKKTVGQAPDYPAAWELLAAVEQKLGNPEAAIDACRAGLKKKPDAHRLLYSLAQLLRQECEFEEAAKVYGRAREQGYRSADSYRNQAEALQESGELDQALECATAGLEHYPEDPLLQRNRARLHWIARAAGDPTELLSQAARRFPRNAALWETLGQLLNRLERQDELGAIIFEAAQLGCPDTPELRRLDALACVHAGASDQATEKFRQLLRNYPEHSPSKLSFAQHLLVTGRADAAEQQCTEVLKLEPYSQLALAYLGTAWQLQNNPRETWLLDYEHMVKPVMVEAPANFSSRSEFFSELKTCLEELHHSKAHPLDQTLRNGTQTNGYLFRLKHALLRVLEQQIREAVRSALADFPVDPQHPFWGRRNLEPRGEGISFAGAWSVRLHSEGFHANHIHPEGWISSALYVALPEEMGWSGEHAGSIQFGTPLDIELPPKRIIRPSVGTLVLFPSYMWHGTVPFTDDQPRITVAFDLIPES